MAVQSDNEWFRSWREIEASYSPGSKQRIPDRRTVPSGSDPENPWVAAPKASRRPDDPGGGWDAKPKIYPFNGADTEFFTIGALATAVKRSKYTVIDWLRKGILPEARYRTKSVGRQWGNAGMRLWSRAQVEGIQRIAQEEGILGEQRRYRRTQSVAHQRFAERTRQMMGQTR